MHFPRPSRSQHWSSQLLIIFLLCGGIRPLRPLFGRGALGFRLLSLGMGLKPPTGLFGPTRFCGMAKIWAKGPKETIIRVQKQNIILLFFYCIQNTTPTNLLQMGLFRTFSPKYGTTLVFRGTSTDITTWYELKTPQSASQCVRIILAQG